MNQCLVFENKKVQMIKTGLILSEQVMKNNDFCCKPDNPSDYNMFLVYKLFTYAKANKAYDKTFNNYSVILDGWSYEW